METKVAQFCEIHLDQRSYLKELDLYVLKIYCNTWWHIMKMTVTGTHYNTQSFNPEGEFTEEAIWSLDTQWGENNFEITVKCYTSPN